MDWRPFKLLNESERGWLARQVRTTLGDWCTAWLPAVPAGAVRCTDPAQRAATLLAAEPSHWLSFTHRDAALSIGHREVALSIALDDDLERWLADALLGAERRSALVDGVTSAALFDLAGRLLQGVQAGAAVPAAAEQAPAQRCWQRGSGAVIVEAELGAHTLALVASPAWVTHRLASRPRSHALPRAELADPRQCVGRARLSLQAWAGSAPVEIGELRTLAPGDVIRLDARIDQPLAVTVQGRDSGGRAWLGRVESRRALQLAPPR
jgi:Type III flagellar switch regulator (C-ring) FliN C-term